MFGFVVVKAITHSFQYYFQLANDGWRQIEIACLGLELLFMRVGNLLYMINHTHIEIASAFSLFAP